MRERAVRVHARLRPRTPSRRQSAIGIVGVLLLWECAVRCGMMDAAICPAPTMLMTELAALARAGILGEALAASGTRWLVGMVLGSTVAVVAAVAAGCCARIGGWVLPWVHLLYPVPKIALLPLFVLWLGIGEWPKSVIIALGAFFPVFINTWNGIRRLPVRYDEVVAVYPVGMGYYLRHILLPATAPAIFVGLKLAAGSALVLLVAAEMLAADTGIGALILHYGDLMLTAPLLACVAVLAAAGLCIQYILGQAERYFVRWR